MSWFSSWFPILPSINYFTVPSSIQRRFISFLLKRSLGHLLKPGQLDIQQIDSQIGSGYVQVNDLQLDNNAINNIISQSGLPLELVDGSLASVTARIPWPNPLTSTLGFSLSGLRLILRVNPTQRPPSSANIDLSDSVASYAESFIQDELTPKEETSLRESFRQDFIASQHYEAEDDNVPGGLNPFRDLSEEEDVGDVDPDGVSLFATLIERLLAKFEFDATDTKATILDPQSSKLTLSVANISYHTELPSGGDSMDRSGRDGESRTVSFSGVTVSGCDLQPVPPESPSPKAATSSRSTRSPSPSSSSDEEVQWAMSQSLAFLPPRPASPASSVSSSIYQSAISEHEFHIDHPSMQLEGPPSVSHSPPVSVCPEEPEGEIFISLGADPLAIKLTTPSVHNRTSSSETLQISVDVGIASCAIRPWHIRSLVRLVDALTSSQSTATTPSNPPSPPNAGTDKQLSVNIKGISLLLLATHSTTISSRSAFDGYFSHPRIPPSLSEGYVRFLLDNISATASIAMTNSKSRRTEPGQPARGSILIFSLSLHEISVFASRPSAGDNEAESLAFPLMITDHLLGSHYGDHMAPTPFSVDKEIPELPCFNVINWTEQAAQKQGMKLSTWRTKPRQSRNSQLSQGPATSEIGRGESVTSALLIKGERQSLEHPLHTTKLLKNNVRVDIAPLQFFVDVRYLLGEQSINLYLDEVLDALGTSNDVKAKSDVSKFETYDQDGDTPPATPRASRIQDTATERERERRRLENLVLRDLDLDIDYREDVPMASKATKGSEVKTSTRSRGKEGPTIVVQFPFIRTNIRCGGSSRSGSIVLDIKGLTLMKGQTVDSRKSASFEPRPASHRSSPPEGDVMLAAEFQRLVLASSAAGSSQASAVLSLGHLRDDHDTEDIPSLPEAQPLSPRIVVSQSLDGSNPSTSVQFVLPSAFVSITKQQLDALQYWADDASQLAQNLPEELSSDRDMERSANRDSSLIGSHYFAKSRTGSGNTSLMTDSREAKADVSVKFLVAEAFFRVHLPRNNEQSIITRPFDIIASDIEALVQVKPKGRDEMVAAVSLMNLVANDHTSQGSRTLISLTRARDLLLTPQPLLKLRFASIVVPETTGKESRITLALWGFTYHFFPDISWISDLGAFASSPPGAFETVVPSERTKISLKVQNGSVKVLAPTHPGALLFHTGDLDFSTELVGESPELEIVLKINSAALLAIDDLAEFHTSSSSIDGFLFWKKCGFALLAEIVELNLSFRTLKDTTSPDTRAFIHRLALRLHLCADTMGVLGDFISDLVSAFKPPSEHQTPKPRRKPLVISEEKQNADGIMSSVDDLAFKKVPEIGPAPDMIFDDLPRNPDYLDESFGTAGGLRELREEDLDDFDDDEEIFPTSSNDSDLAGIVSRVGGETVRMLRPEGLQIVDNYFDKLPPISENSLTDAGETTFRAQIYDTDVNVFLYDGYDWANTRRTIENEVKEMRKRLAKIRQLVAQGQTQQSAIEETSAFLFNSVYIGLKQDADELDPTALIAAIDEELKGDPSETATESSWQSLPVPSLPRPSVPSTRLNGKRLARAKGPSIEFRVAGLDADFAQYSPKDSLVSRMFVTVTDIEILDHIKTSTWKKFLTALRSDSRGNIRETDSRMVKVELRTIRPVANDPSEEARLKAKILPLRLHVDQDALDFMKKFFSFADPNRSSTPSDPEDGIYFQLAEIFPVDLKLDYKPRRVDYRALKEGRTIELMNFFHFDGAEMTLRHITLSGITGWPRLGELLNDLWTPDVKATQLVDVISGVAPIRSMVNVGSGIADLVLLPIAQYKKDGRIVHGMQKGTTAFVKSTAIEAIKLGAKLATGTQVILEQAEGVLGPQFKYPITTETLQPSNFGVDDLMDPGLGSSDEEDNSDLISKYADQPMNVKEGVQSAYKSLQKNLNSAAQTILAVPMEVYERSGNEGPVRSVIRAVPIAVLKPMIGASEAVSKTLLGLHNSLDPNLRHENDAKYKHR
ncbi:hypothetical protein GYMLUDRAFT_75350 [Collybiopsis luxurians FD-317 M1]|uniref:Autophagy-related protein 2 n=1 Tax=Collybiopsis luxurians FD-317 M1 TaxID=944289 RepID=A0A0D0BR99_9AGAR|nr:hypothetical protein GYMLUDRAFT_75350 [Collybiopsis luxurians FD-317 M1]